MEERLFYKLIAIITLLYTCYMLQINNNFINNNTINYNRYFLPKRVLLLVGTEGSVFLSLLC